VYLSHTDVVIDDCLVDKREDY